MYDPFATMRRLHERGPQSRGLAVDAEGVTLGPDCTLIRRTPSGYRCPGPEEIAHLIDAVLDDDPRLRRLPIVLAGITEALNAGDLVKAQLLGLEIPLPDLDDEQLARLRLAGDLMKDFDPNQPRDERGRWTSDGGSDADGDPREPQADGTAIADQWLSLVSTPLRSDNSGIDGVTEAGANSEYHDYLVEHLAQIARDSGGQAVTHVTLNAVTGDTAIADLIVKPKGWPLPFILEVKTGNDPTFTRQQAIVYPLAMIGGHVTSSKKDVTQLGLVPGLPFPPLPVLTVYTHGPGAKMYYKWWTPEFHKLLLLARGILP